MRFSPKLLMLGAMLTLSSCGATVDQRPQSTSILALPSTQVPMHTSATSADPLCHSLTIVQLSRNDTTGTKEQVEKNNHVLQEVCG